MRGELLFTEGIAYHEAAHMVVAWELGLSVAGATMVPDPEGYYQARVLVPVEDRVRYAVWVDEYEYLYSHLVVRFAGPAASDKFTGVPTPPKLLTSRWALLAAITGPQPTLSSFWPERP